jgi:hypothetical protein
MNACRSTFTGNIDGFFFLLLLSNTSDHGATYNLTLITCHLRPGSLHLAFFSENIWTLILFLSTDRLDRFSHVDISRSSFSLPFSSCSLFFPISHALPFSHSFLFFFSLFSFPTSHISSARITNGVSLCTLSTLASLNQKHQCVTPFCSTYSRQIPPCTPSCESRP